MRGKTPADRGSVLGMSDAKREFRAQVDRAIEELKAMRDEIKLKLHLGGMDAKDAWKKLEPRETASELRRSFEELRGRLKD
jgi:hypothetical protein